MINSSRLIEKGNGFQFAPSGGISDTTLLTIASQFRTNISRKYKTSPAKSLSKLYSPEETTHASVKYDGEGVFVYYDNEKNECFAFNSPSGRTRKGLPCLQKTKEKLEKAGVRKALLVAELHLIPLQNQRTRVSDVIHATSNGTSEERERLALAFYDIIMLDGVDLRENQTNFLENWKKLSQIFPQTESQETAHLVESKLIAGKNLEEFFQETTQTRGLEGIVVRSLGNPTIYKIKPSISIDAVVTGYVEGEFEQNYGVLSLLCALTAPDNKTIQTLCRVGSGFSDELREKLTPTLQNLKCDAPVPLTDSDGRPITFVKPSLVVEIDGESLQEQTLTGEAITNQTFIWDGEAYQFQYTAPSALITHATFSRLREDKEWTNGGTRMEQALSENTIKEILNPVKETPTPSKILVREVFRKENKGNIAIRKILAIEKNQKGFHRYTIHYTDFSQGRSETLKTETRVADSQERLEEILESFRLEGNKKGWTKV